MRVSVSDPVLKTPLAVSDPMLDPVSDVDPQRITHKRHARTLPPCTHRHTGHWLIYDHRVSVTLDSLTVTEI